MKLLCPLHPHPASCPLLITAYLLKNNYIWIESGNSTIHVKKKKRLWHSIFLCLGYTKVYISQWILIKWVYTYNYQVNRSKNRWWYCILSHFFFPFLYLSQSLSLSVYTILYTTELHSFFLYWTFYIVRQFLKKF